MECTTNCLSKQHGKYLTAAFTCEDLETLKTIVKEKCSNPLRNSDNYGKTILHVCASIGRYDVLSWLCDEWKISNILQTKDKESGWTSLHRALYFGHIDCAILMYKLVQDWYAVDFEGHSPLDLVMLDSPRTKKMKIKKGKLATVVVPFEAGEAGELTLNLGDTVEIISTKDTDKTGWSFGRLQGTNLKGLFPITMVEEIKETIPVESCTKQFLATDDVYTWGNNVNFNLGIGDSKNRSNPELVECLWSKSISVKHCVITKFHSVFLTNNGNIFTCGHGLHGRLGHGNEETVLYPKMVEYFENIRCIDLDAAHSHTIVLDELGRVYTFGFNDFHQLGHSPPPSFSTNPKQISNKSLKSKGIVGVSAGRFHSVIHTKYEVYTFGLNAGQLGHPKGDKLITNPKLVTHLYKKEISITKVATSDGATICLLANGDLYLLQQYVCRKIALRLIDVSVISVTGGVLQCTELESFNKPEPLKIAILRSSGVVEVWKSGFSYLKKCYWLGQKFAHSKIIHIALGRHLILTTDAGQVYFGHFLKSGDNSSNSSTSSLNVTAKKVEVQSGNFTLTEIMDRCKKERSESEEVNLVKIPLLYRAVKCVSDAKSRTFAAIQRDARNELTKYPNIQSSCMVSDLKELLRSASINDDIHDAVIKTKTQVIPVHRFILENRLGKNELDSYISNGSGYEERVFQFPWSPEEVRTWLGKVYIGEDTSVLPCGKDGSDSIYDHSDLEFAKSMSSLSFIDLENPLDENLIHATKSKKSKKRSAFAVYQDNIHDTKKINGKANGSVKFIKKNSITSLGTFCDWKGQKHLSDVTIESVDGCLFPCHKCILTSRAEYFNHMLNSTWIESSLGKGRNVKIPIPGNVLNVVLNYLYTDEANTLKEMNDITFIGEVLVSADQLLLTRLRDICERELTEKVCLKNAVEIFQFSCDFNVEQLTQSTSEFISLNLPYFLESRLLEYLSEECLQLLSKGYQDMVVGMYDRKIGPSHDHRKMDDLEKAAQELTINDLNKIKSRRGRLSSSRSSQSSRSKSVNSIGESDLDQSVSIYQLSNDVFEKTLPNNDSNVTSVESSPDKAKTPPVNKTISNGVVHVNNEQGKQNGIWNTKEQYPSHRLNEDQSSGIVSPPKKISPFKKKSQKERRKENVQSPEPMNGETPIRVKEEKPSICPWGKSPQKPQVSFREVMCEEKPMVDKKKQRMRTRTVSFSKELVKKKSSGNPWQVIPKAETSNNCGPNESSFINIVTVQQEEKKQLTEQSKKPLSVIQLEEKAMEELKLHYQLISDHSEYITVQRIKPVTASPYWDVDIRK